MNFFLEHSELLAIFGYLIAGVAPLTQVIRTLQVRNTSTTSLLWPNLILLALLLILPAVLNTHEPILVVGHVSGILTNALNLTLLIAYRKGPLATKTRATRAS